MYVDRKGKPILIGDRVKRVAGGEHGGMEEGDIGIVCKNHDSMSPRSIFIKGKGSHGYDPRNFEVLSNKKNHLPEWL